MPGSGKAGRTPLLLRATLTRSVGAALVIGALLLLFIPRVEAATTFTYVVNSVGDTHDSNLLDGACDATCTLRGAIEQANDNCARAVDPTVSTTIRFGIEGTGVHTITPHEVTGTGPGDHLAPLPTVSCPVVIDGWSQGGAGYHGPPLIELDGSSSALHSNAPGLAFGNNDNGSTVQGLVVNRWGG